MKRLLTAVIGVPCVLAAVFLLPGPAFFAFLVLLVGWATYEFLVIVRPRAAHAPLSVLLGLVPLLGGGIAYALSRPGAAAGGAPVEIVGVALVATIGLGSLVLFARLPLEETLATLGILSFGTAYLAVPLASLYLLRQRTPWLIFLLMAIVWLGDTAAYYIGSRFGRHKMAPTISPKKSWEGAVAGFVTSILAAAIFSQWRLGYIHPGLLAVAAVTAAASQVGDLVESLIKRGSGVKDSGSILPGHGGVLDRIDAMLFAAPVLLLGVLLGAVP